MTTKTSDLKIASFSDVHLGHPNTPTAHILANLEKEFPNTPETGELDAIWIVGDLFDRGLNYFSPDVSRIQRWAIRFFGMCIKRGITLRILEGTKSHDRHQASNLMELLAELLESHPDAGNADIKFVDTLSVEYISKLGITVLYVPDDLNPDTDVTWSQVNQLLAAEGLTSVDYTLLHGSFSYQLPDFVKSPKHDPDRYLGITNRFVFAGHIHKSSRYDRILAHGSFDRLVHGEEEPKGYWRVNGEHARFVENTNAFIYKTVDCVGVSTEEALERCQFARNLPVGSYVRVMAGNTDPILTNIDLLRNTYPLIRWSTKPVESEDKQTNLLVDLRETFHEIEITPQNIEGLLLGRLETLNVPESTRNECRDLLKEFIDV